MIDPAFAARTVTRLLGNWLARPDTKEAVVRLQMDAALDRMCLIAVLARMDEQMLADTSARLTEEWAALIGRLPENGPHRAQARAAFEDLMRTGALPLQSPDPP